MVHEFMEYRPYVSISQFRKEMAKYVDAEKIAGYEQHLYVPIDPSASDAATLLQLPGLDAGGGREAHRPPPVRRPPGVPRRADPAGEPCGARGGPGHDRRE